MDRLEQRLRSHLGSDRWTLSPDEHALARIHEGVRRRRQRRRSIATGALGAVLVAAVGGGAVATLGDSLRTNPASEAAGGADSGGTANSAEDGADDGREDTRLSYRDDQRTPKTATTMMLDPSKGVPHDFAPVSVSAVGAERFWVLGDASGATLARTDDGGATFTTVDAPDAPVARADDAADAATVRDVRFADSRHGWAYGGGLWLTHDGGESWTAVDTVPGEVRQLESDGEAAYALVQDGGEWTVWRNQAGTDSWRRLDVALSAPEDLAAVDGLLAVTDADRTSTAVWVSTDSGATFRRRATPCQAELSAGRLSATRGALWLVCGTGTAAAVHVSDDAGATWSQVRTGLPAIPNSAPVGALSATEAIVPLSGATLEVRATAAATPTDVEGLDRPSYVGFSTRTVGYILDGDGALFRTTDGGRHWTKVSFH